MAGEAHPDLNGRIVFQPLRRCNQRKPNPPGSRQTAQWKAHFRFSPSML
jgi:hypothetical protein